MAAVRAIVFDLDDTLFPVGALPAGTFASVMAAARDANVGMGAIPTERLEAALVDAQRLSFPAVAARHRLPPAVCAAWSTAHRPLVVSSPLEPFDDVRPVLGGLPHLRFLVTTGYERFQQSKIDALEIRGLFHGVYIDAVDGPGGATGKADVFRRLLAEWRLSPDEVVVVGDNEESELAAGRRLGMMTVQVLRPGVTPASAVDARIGGLRELTNAIDRLACARPGVTPDTGRVRGPAPPGR